MTTSGPVRLDDGLASSPRAMSDLRDGLLNALSAFIGDQEPPEGADEWLDQLTDAAADDALPDVARILDEALERAQARAIAAGPS